jgi:2-polyprenyl-6-methoxyphenol hydroxylase-like FAD-dependent oxidoreductase
MDDFTLKDLRVGQRFQSTEGHCYQIVTAIQNGKFKVQFFDPLNERPTVFNRSYYWVKNSNLQRILRKNYPTEEVE